MKHIKKLFESNFDFEKSFDECFLEICDKYDVDIVYPSKDVWPEDYTDLNLSGVAILDLKEKLDDSRLIDIFKDEEFESRKYDTSKSILNLLIEINDSVNRFNKLSGGDHLLVGEILSVEDEVCLDIQDSFDGSVGIVFYYNE